MSYEKTGQVSVIGDTQEFGTNGFTKRSLVITFTDGKYENLLELILIKDRTALADSLTVGDIITADFDVRSREHNGRYFTEAVCWRLKAENAQEPAPDDGLDMGSPAPF